MPYPFHIALILTLVYLAYQFLLSKETFYKTNRYILLFGIAVSFILPIMQISQEWSLKTKWKTLVFTPQKSHSYVYQGFTYLNNDKYIENIPSANKNVKDPIHSPISGLTCSDDALSTHKQPVPEKVESQKPVSYVSVIKIIYLLGTGVFTLLFLLQLCRLAYFYFTGTKSKDGVFSIIENGSNPASFSFLSLIFLNKNVYDGKTYDQILEHEKIHARSAHSFDMVIAQFLVIIQWFNPIAWFYKKAIENNLEFITDQVMLRNGSDRQGYQLSLLKVAAPHSNISLTSKYNQSSLKKRIIMMNKQKSSNWNSWKYFLILPLLGLSVICFNSVRAVATETELTAYTVLDLNPQTHANGILSIQSQSPEEARHIIPLQKGKLDQASSTGAGATQDTTPVSAVPPPPPPPGAISRANPSPPRPPKPPRATSPEVAPKAPNPSKPTSPPMPPPPIPPTPPKAVDAVKDGHKVASSISNNFHLVNGIRLNLTEGKWEANNKNGLVCIQFSKEDKDNHWMWSDCFQKSKFKGLENVDNQLVVFTRDAGTMRLSGTWKTGKGSGSYSFEGSSSFRSFINSKGNESVSDETLVQCFIADIDKEYIAFLIDNGFAIDSENIGRLTAHGIEYGTIKDFVKTLRNVGIDHAGLDNLLKLHAHGIQPSYIEEMHSNLDGENMSIDDYVQLAMHGVEPNFIGAAMRSGLSDVGSENLIRLHMHGVDMSYLSEMKKTGIKNLDTEEIIKFAMHGISPDYVKMLSQYSPTALSNDNIIRASNHGVDVDYVRELSKTGIEDFDAIIRAATHGIDGEYIKDLKTSGIRDLDIDAITLASMHGIRNDDIAEIIKLGFHNVSIEELIQTQMHGIRAEDIERAQMEGVKSDRLEDYLEHLIKG